MKHIKLQRTLRRNQVEKLAHNDKNNQIVENSKLHIIFGFPIHIHSENNQSI